MELPNNINLDKLAKLLVYSSVYELSIQFWPEQTAVFICKGGVDLKDFGGDFDFAVDNALEYLNRINNSDKPLAFKSGQKFKIKNDIDNAVYEFIFIDFDNGVGEVHCYDSERNVIILEETYLSDLEHV